MLSLHKPYIMIRGLFLLFSCTAYAYARIEGATAQPSINKTGSETTQSAKNAAHTTAVMPKKNIFKHHMIAGSFALRVLDIDDFSYSSFNGQAIQNIAQNDIDTVSFDFSVAYHYRPAPTYSFGVSFDRLQVNQATLDLRYSSTDPVPPDPDTLPAIASDLVSNGDPYAVANYYAPVSCGNRGYAYEGVVRAYIIPKWKTDPFLQATLGYTHNRGSVHRQDSSISIYDTDQLWTWSVGGGWSYPINETFKFETSLIVRNQNKMQFSDSISAPSQNAQYSFIGTADRYYSADFKISLCQTW